MSIAIEAQEWIRVDFVERIRHVYSQYRTNDEELNFAESILEPAETIEITADLESETTKVTVSTEQAVYHFRTFRSDYIGHGSRTLVSMLQHFRVVLPLEFLVAHKSLTVYLTGNKIVAQDTEYPIDLREDYYEMVEPVEWMMSSSVLDVVLRLANEYQVQPVEIAESAMKLIAEKRDLEIGDSLTMDDGIVEQ